MVITIEATYENGTLKLDRTLPLNEHEKVRVTIETGTNSLAQAYGLSGWTGDSGTLEQIALDPEFLPD